MRSERGQASVEWIVLVLLLALALTALARFAPRADAGDLGADLMSTMTCAVRGGCEAKHGTRRPGGVTRSGGAPAGSGTPAGGGTASRLVTAPPLVPVAPRTRDLTRPPRRGLTRPSSPAAGPRPAPGWRPWLRPTRFGPLVRRGGRGAGVLWRRSWMLCLGYERVRYSLLHPEIRFPNKTIPVSEDLRIANDCLSPVDLVRDFGRPSKP